MCSVSLVIRDAFLAGDVVRVEPRVCLIWCLVMGGGFRPILEMNKLNTRDWFHFPHVLWSGILLGFRSWKKNKFSSNPSCSDKDLQASWEGWVLFHAD